MAKANCRNIVEDATALLSLIGPEDILADWMEYYISGAKARIKSAYSAWSGMADRYRAGIRAGVKTNPALTSEPFTEASYMVRPNLAYLVKHAQLLHDLIEPGERLPDWMEDKIAVARYYIESVRDKIEFLNTIG
jgi:hypothetical protein